MTSLPKGTYHAADRIFETGEGSEEEQQTILRICPRSQRITESTHYISCKADVFQIISFDDRCKLNLELGVGSFSFISGLVGSSNLTVEHGHEIKYYDLEKELRSILPSTANFRFKGKLYAFSGGMVNIVQEPMHETGSRADLQTEHQILLGAGIFSLS